MTTTSTTTSIPGELFLLLTTDAGRQDATPRRRQALAAAALAELALAGKVALGDGRDPRVEVLDTASTGVPVLDQALGALTDLSGWRVSTVLSHRWMDLTEVIGVGFAAAGVVSRRVGWFSTTWPTEDHTLERALRARLAIALVGPAPTGADGAGLHDGILLELLRALGIAHRILEDDVVGLDPEGLDRAIAELRIDHPSAAAIGEVIDAMTAVMAAGSSVGAPS
jgi:Golgi phosphoprotein 3 (GPP34)